MKYIKRFFIIIITIVLIQNIMITPATAINNNLYRRMEDLDRGLVVIGTEWWGNNFLSWRLLGTESLENQAFDIYRNGKKIYTTGVHDPTQWADYEGKVTDTYQVVRAGENPKNEKSVGVNQKVYGYGDNSCGYVDIKFEFPKPDIRTGDDGKPWLDENGKEVIYNYHADNTSIGDLDGDGEYELVTLMLAAESTNMAGYTSPAYLYGLDVNWQTGDTKKMWEISLGTNVTSGQHYNCFLVYDLDCDNKAEVMVKTSAGSKDGDGKYVSEVGNTKEIKNTDNTKQWISRSYGKNMDGPEFLTIFNGKTGSAMQTINYEPGIKYNNIDWGDGFDNRSGRYNCTVAYLDGERPYAVFNRGIYTYCYYSAYSWDGKNLKRYWFSENNTDGTSKVTYGDGTVVKENKTAACQGNHNLKVADCDNDGKDEIVTGSAVIDHDGTVLYSTGRGHGDAMHVSDYNNDGITEVYQVHEYGAGGVGADLKQYDATSENGYKDLALFMNGGDVGRGMIGNINDEYALNNPNASAIYWNSASGMCYDINGKELSGAPATNAGNTMCFTLLWDGDLGIELLASIGAAAPKPAICKYHIGNDEKGILQSWTERKSFERLTNVFPGVGTNNATKAQPCLTADILGDWREEAIFPTSEGMRMFTTAYHTNYRLTTLMHDGQYRCQVSSENSGYNQPPQPSYYIGSLALAKDANGEALNYLAPAKEFTKVYDNNHEHKYDNGVITKEATYDEEGEKTYTCKICNKTKIEIIPKLNKKPENNVVNNITDSDNNSISNNSSSNNTNTSDNIVNSEKDNQSNKNTINNMGYKDDTKIIGRLPMAGRPKMLGIGIAILVIIYIIYYLKFKKRKNNKKGTY